MTAEAEIATAGRREHLVVFYRDDEQLAGLVSHYVLPAVQYATPAIIIATPERIRSVETHLGATGSDLAAARVSGGWRTMDAAGAIRGFLVGGRPDPARFWQVITPELRLAGSTGQPVRVFGEMVWLLWDAGLVAAAIEVEAMWNELAARYDFTLLCAYPQRSVRGDGHLDALAEVCRLHARVIDAAPHAITLGAALAPARPGFPAGARLSGDHRREYGHQSSWPQPGAADQRGSSPHAGAPLSKPPEDAAVLAYRADLPAVRQFVALRARQAGLPPTRVNDLVLAVSELAANTLAHTSGPGTLTVWFTSTEVICQVHDQGQITGRLAGRNRPHPAADGGGRGLWLVHQVCDLVEKHTSTAGTTIRLHMRRRPRPA